jgi:hypothetical protein
MTKQTHTAGITAVQFRSKTGGAGGACEGKSILEIYAGDYLLFARRMDEIVRAVNSHDALLDDLGAIVTPIPPIGELELRERIAAINGIARAAIEKGKTP